MPHNRPASGFELRLGVALAASLTIGACVTAIEPTTAHAGDPANGRALAQNLCAGCHAIDAGSASPNADAPPLRTVLAGYPPDRLAADLDSARHIAFLQMPQFHLGEHGGADLVAYIQSIETN